MLYSTNYKNLIWQFTTQTIVKWYFSAVISNIRTLYVNINYDKIRNELTNIILYVDYVDNYTVRVISAGNYNKSLHKIQ